MHVLVYKQKALGQLSWLLGVCVVMLHTNFPPAPSPPPHLIIAVSIVLVAGGERASANANRLMAARSFGARQRAAIRCIYFPQSLT